MSLARVATLYAICALANFIWKGGAIRRTFEGYRLREKFETSTITSRGRAVRRTLVGSRAKTALQDTPANRVPAYYDAVGMPSVRPRNVEEVDLVWPDGYTVGPKQHCGHSNQRSKGCSLAFDNGEGHFVEALIDGAVTRAERHPPLEMQGIGTLPAIRFHELNSYCRFRQVDVFDGAIDMVRLRQYVQDLTGRSYEDQEIEIFVTVLAFMSEQQLRTPELVADNDEAFYETFFPRDGLPRDDVVSRQLYRNIPNGSTEYAEYGNHYTCEPDDSIDESIILKNLGCTSLIFWRPPNYLRAAAIGCSLATGAIKPLLEVKGAGLPLFAPLTKQPSDTFLNGVFSQGLRYLMNKPATEVPIQFALERGIDRWRKKDHGSGTIDLEEAHWEFSLDKFITKTFENPLFHPLREEACRFMHRYLSNIYGENGYLFRLRHHIYGSPLPSSLALVEGCDVAIETVPHFVAFDTKWSGRGNNGNVQQGLLIRGLSKREFVSYYSEPDIFGHPGANHHTAGIVAGLYGVASILPHTMVDHGNSSLMGQTWLGRALQNYLRNVHKTHGKFFYMNLQADQERTRLFDYGHVGIRKKDQQFSYLTRNENTYSKRDMNVSRALLDYWKNPSADHPYAHAQNNAEVAVRLLDVWLEMSPNSPSGLSGKVWMYNQMLYWDAVLAIIIHRYIKHIHVAANAVSNARFFAELGLGAPVDTPCPVVEKLLTQFIARRMTDTTEWAQSLTDTALINVDFMYHFFDAFRRVFTLREDQDVFNVMCSCVFQKEGLHQPQCVDAKLAQLRKRGPMGKGMNTSRRMFNA